MSDKPNQSQNPIQLFISLVFQGYETWQQAGEIAAAEFKKNPKFVDEVCDLAPHVSEAWVHTFIKIGNKKLHPRLAMDASAGARRLRRLPYELQEKYCSETVPLLVKTDTGYDTLQMDFRNLTPDQAVQLFTDRNVRTAAEQRAWIEDRLTKRAAELAAAKDDATTTPYKVVGRHIVTRGPVRIDGEELLPLIVSAIGAKRAKAILNRLFQK